MSHRNRIASIVVAWVTVICCTKIRVLGKDYFVTIGGGYDETGNQLSLERNVVFQQSVLAAKRPDRPPHDVWFADGDDPHRDLQCRNPKYETEVPEARRLLAELLGDGASADIVYRNHEIPHVRGGANLDRVKQHFADLARQVKAGDRVLVYFSGHGGKARRGRRREGQSRRNLYNTTIQFWDNEQATVSEFTSWLDRFPPEAEVVLVMVQCYAGGFAHTIFQRADASAGLAEHARCGFFAQLHDRSAAGCTPDADEGDYEEYSTYFWGALGGRSRVGQSAVNADYDHDGQISFAEAHAYAVIESNTIDVPVRTSDSLLRQYNGDRGGEEAVAGEVLRETGPVAKLVPLCRPDQRAILAQLLPKLKLGASATIEDVEQTIADFDSRLETAETELAAAERTEREARRNVQEELYRIWPELRGEWAPLGVELVTDRAKEFVGSVQKLPNYATWQYAHRRAEELTKAALQLERDKARAERVLRECETIVLGANLPKVAKPEIVDRYQRLLALEGETLQEAAPSGQ